jgi:hypothetical protein
MWVGLLLFWQDLWWSACIGGNRELRTVKICEAFGDAHQKKLFNAGNEENEVVDGRLWLLGIESFEEAGQH